MKKRKRSKRYKKRLVHIYNPRGKVVNAYIAGIGSNDALSSLMADQWALGIFTFGLVG